MNDSTRVSLRHTHFSMFKRTLVFVGLQRRIKSFSTTSIAAKEWRRQNSKRGRQSIRVGSSIYYSSVLRECSKMKSLAEGKRVHAYMIKTGFEPDIIIGNHLVNMYAKCGNLADAHQVFDKMPERNVVSWTAVITGYSEQRHGEQAFKLFSQMQRTGIEPNQFTFASVICSCVGFAALEVGQQVHACVIKSEFDFDVFVANALVTMYAECGRIDDARQVFNKNYEADLISWNAMISGYTQHGYGEEALELYSQMLQAGMKPNQFSFPSVLVACASLAAVEHGKQVHTGIIKTGFKSDVYVGSALVDMYAKSNSIEDACKVFDAMPLKSTVSWNAMIVGYVQKGCDQEALKLFCQMQHTVVKLDHFTFASIVGVCANLAGLEQGKQLHAQSIRTGYNSNVFVGNAFVTMYAKCGSLEDAWLVFDKMAERNVVSWTAMTSGYVQRGQCVEALKLYCQMQRAGVKPNEFTFATVLSACTNVETLERGRQLHGLTIRAGFHSDGFVHNALVTMYAECGTLKDARLLFNKVPERDVVLWNAMISGYVRHRLWVESHKLFCEMQWTGMKANQFTVSSVLTACAALRALEKGKQVHSYIVKTGFNSDVCVGSTLVDMYAKCGRIEDAYKVFDRMLEYDVVLWNAMIVGYSQNWHLEEVMRLYFKLRRTGIVPDQFTFASVIGACANIAASERGREVHAHLIKTGFESDLCVGNALVDMYAKCGSMIDALNMFEDMTERDVVSWTAIIAGYAQHGCGNEALHCFEQMQGTGIKPNDITFVSVLSACSHAGLVIEGLEYFDSMSRDHNLMPKVEHYACMVDLLGRAGYLPEAERFIITMPFESTALVWRTFLAACRIHGNVELGKSAAECILQLEPQDAATYVLLSNMYAAVGRWNDVAKVRTMMRDKGVKKAPAYSWIEVKNRVHAFVVEDRSHPQTEEIYAMLARLARQIEDAGYVPDTNFALHDVEQKQKEQLLWHHSERLAIAFGFINKPVGTPIRIMKNLRVCGDCHDATKFISKVVGREIVVRDANRFHHFKDGLCSCSDFW